MADAVKQNVIKSILNLHAKDGARIRTIRDEYREIEGCDLEASEADAIAYLWSMAEVVQRGEFFHSRSVESQHIAKLVKETKSTPRRPLRRASCYFDRDHSNEDEMAHLNASLRFEARVRGRSPMRNGRQEFRHRSRSFGRSNNGFAGSLSAAGRRNSPPNTTRNNAQWLPQQQQQQRQPLAQQTRDPRLRDSEHDYSIGNTMPTVPPTSNAFDSQFKQFGIVADDFFFNYILEYTMFRQQPDDCDNPHQSKWSFCVIGQTIDEAIKLIRSQKQEKISDDPINVIVNIGATDICRGAKFHEIVHNFMNLIDTCEKYNFSPTIVTLLPFSAAITHASEDVAWRVHYFNKFLLDNFTDVIDLWSCITIGFSRSLGNLFDSNGVSKRFAGRDTDITWVEGDEEMRLEHRGKA